MSNKSENYINASKKFFGMGKPVGTNTPTQYASRQKQYMAKRSIVFDNQRAYLSSDYFNAEVQGLNPDDFYSWVNTNIRLSDVSKTSSATATKKTDDYKEVLLPEYHIDYFPIGAKIITAGNTWICINPSNISSVKTTALVARCNASYNSFDDFGNVVTEPIVVEKYSMLGNDNEKPNNLVLMDGYFNITCQLNDNTRRLHQNSRIMLGTNVYHITGMTDFIQEFTGDRNSCHLLTFTVRLEEVTDADDVTKNFIANGNNYSFSASISGISELNVGQTAQMTAHFKATYAEDLLPSSQEATWTWSSSDENVVTVDEDGVVTAKSVGNATIQAVMEQNTAISSQIELAVKQVNIAPYVAFNGAIPSKLTQYGTIDITAAYYENGVETDNELTWKFGGANFMDYGYVIGENGKEISLACFNASKEPLIITVEYGEYSAKISIELEGY